MKEKGTGIRIYPDGRVDAKDAAAYLGLSANTLANMRMHGTGPRFVKRGRVFYFKDDLDSWMRDGLVQTTAEARVKKAMAG